MIEKYQRQRELKLRKDEERKSRQKKRARDAMCETLAKQQVEKHAKLAEDKKDLNQQAEMWKKDRDVWAQEDARLREKISKINKDTMTFLKKQVAEKEQKKSKRMDVQERALNKALMKEIKSKKKGLEEQRATDMQKRDPDSESINDRQ